MTYVLGTCSHPGCTFSHGVHYVRASRPAPTDSVGLGTGGGTSTLPEMPERRRLGRSAVAETASHPSLGLAVDTPVSINPVPAPRPLAGALRAPR